jgi:hypothetical protein
MNPRLPEWSNDRKTLRVPLTKGKWATVDACDEWVCRWNWIATCNNKVWYAQRWSSGGSVSMHREILRPNPGTFVDHVDRDGLNNVRSNLRACTRVHNQWNRGANRNNTSGFKGVSALGSGYRATISANGRTIHLGMFDTAEAASEAYRIAAARLHEEFCWTEARRGVR